MRLGLINLNLAQQLFQGSSNQVEGFGQAESLTSRLRTILDMYPDGNPIFSELIQNADDAGATRLDILLDETRYPTESLLDAKMTELQVGGVTCCSTVSEQLFIQFYICFFYVGSCVSCSKRCCFH